jgi:8-oxo-dGTP diphosphatase
MSDVEHAPERVAFCARCGGSMITKAFQGKPRRRCASCGFIHFEEPKVAVAAMVVDDGKLLLIQRAVTPEKGKWSLPAGYLDLGESPREGVAREVGEETGLDVEVGDLVDVYYNPPGQGAAVVLVYRARMIGGKLEAADDASAAGFFGPHALPELAFDSTRDIAQQAAKLTKTV